MSRQSRIGWILAAIGVLAALVIAFRPGRVPVETATVTTGLLQETLDEEGKTRMHDHFIIAAPIAGKLRRIELHAGDPVRPGEVVAWIDPAPIEPRQTAVLEARLEAARAARREAAALLGRAQAEYDQALSDRGRSEKLFQQGVISKESLEKATTAVAASTRQLEAAKSRAEFSAHQLDEATAALSGATSDTRLTPVPVQSPVNGRVLRLLEQSEKVLVPGAPMIEIGYTPRLEVVADFLTTDAVKIHTGMNAIVDDWGGEEPLPARVRTVEPGAFTKVSALGVEEQRVNVVLDFTDGSANLADAYRVEVRVITWENRKALKIPVSSIFRSAEDWAVFQVANGAAHHKKITPGHRGDYEVEVFDGLREGDSVIVHPSPDLKDGIRVVATPRSPE